MIINKTVASLSNLISSHRFVKNCETTLALVCLPFSILYASSIFLPGPALTVTAKGKGTYTQEIGYKEQTERNRCNWGESVFFLFRSLSFFVSWGPSFPREIVSEKMAKITSEIALFSTGSVNLYIHGRPFIHSNVNPFLFRSNRPFPLLSFSLSFLLLLRSFNFLNYVPSYLYNTPGKRSLEIVRELSLSLRSRLDSAYKRRPLLLRHLSSTSLLY